MREFHLANVLFLIYILVNSSYGAPFAALGNLTGITKTLGKKGKGSPLSAIGNLTGLSKMIESDDASKSSKNGEDLKKKDPPMQIQIISFPPAEQVSDETKSNVLRPGREAPPNPRLNYAEPPLLSSSQPPDTVGGYSNYPMPVSMGPVYPLFNSPESINIMANQMIQRRLLFSNRSAASPYGSVYYRQPNDILMPGGQVPSNSYNYGLGTRLMSPYIPYFDPYGYGVTPLPQGNSIQPYFMNSYLDGYDQTMPGRANPYVRDGPNFMNYQEPY